MPHRGASLTHHLEPRQPLSITISKWVTYPRPWRERRVTIGDVAAEAGVSVATVSKVINGRWGVAEDTSARVRRVIEQLGYQSSLVAQSLRSRSTNVIGVLVVDIEPFSAELLKGVARAIQGPGYELVVFSGCGRAADQVGWERRYLVPGERDAVRRRDPRHAEQRRRDLRRPVVAVDHNVGSSSLPTVDSDNLSGAVIRDGAPDRAGPPPDRVPRRSSGSRVGPASRARLPPALEKAGHRRSTRR